MNDAPGKMLSSSLTGSGAGADKQQHPKLGACVGVFFQLFDWNRKLTGKGLFSNKLLPAERPKRTSKKYSEDKLQMAKLLLIADENRGGFPMPKRKASDTTTPPRVDACGEKPNMRTPGLVARLMGLESMPAPNPPKKANEALPYKGMEDRPVQDFLQKKQDSIVPSMSEKQYKGLTSSSFKRQFNNFIRNSSDSDKLTTAYLLKETKSKNQVDALPQSTDVKACKVLSNRTRPKVPYDRFDDPKVILFSRLPSLSPKPDSPLRSILSPSKSCNKFASPIKSPLAAKRAARLIEAAAKILEPSMQHNNRSRSSAIRSSVARPLLRDCDLDGKAENKPSGKVVAPKKAPPHNTWRGQPSSKSWNGLGTDQSTQRHRPSSQVSGKDQIRQNKQQARTQMKTEHMKSDIYGKRRDREKHAKPANSACETTQETSSKETEHLACPQPTTAKGQLHLVSPACQESLQRSGSVKGEVPICGEKLGDSRSTREDRAKVTMQDKSKSESRRLSGMALRQSDIASSAVRKQELDCKKSSQVTMNKNLCQKQAVLKQDGSASRSLPADDISAIDERLRCTSGCSQSNNALPSPSSSQCTNQSTTTSQKNGSSVLSYSRIFGSSKDGKSRSKERESRNDKTQKKGDSSFVMSFLRRKPATGAESVTTGTKKSSRLKASSEVLDGAEANVVGKKSVKGIQINTTEQLDLNGSTFEGKFLNEDYSLDFKDLPSSPSYMANKQVELRDNNLEDASMNKELSDFSSEAYSKATVSLEIESHSTNTVSPSTPSLSLAGAGTPESKNRHVDDIASSCFSDVRGPENSLQSSCDSCSLSSGEIRDTASTNGFPGSGNKRESLSLTGKTTSAILHELLLALNTSMSQFPAEMELPDVSRIADGSASFCSQLSDTDYNCQKVESSHGCQLQHLQSVDTVDYGETRELHLSSSNTRLCLQECEMSSETAAYDEFCQPSPISILESPFQDESSSSSDTFERIQGSKLLYDNSRLVALQTSNVKLNVMDEDEYVRDIVCLAWEDLQLRQWQQLEDLSPVDPSLFFMLASRLAERGWSFPLESCCEAMYEPLDSTLRKTLEQAAWQNHKLIFDCVNEALSGKLGSSLPSQACVQRRVCKQIEEWRDMGGRLMVDEIVEKEMGKGRWRDVEEEVGEIGMEMEGRLLGSLVEELVEDLAASMVVRKT